MAHDAIMCLVGLAYIILISCFCYLTLVFLAPSLDNSVLYNFCKQPVLFHLNRQYRLPPLFKPFIIRTNKAAAVASSFAFLDETQRIISSQANELIMDFTKSKTIRTDSLEDSSLTS